MNEEKLLSKPIVEIKDLHKSFGENEILKGFNLILNEGESVVVMGKSGSGKSVMIKCLIGLEQYDSGSVTIMGQDLTKFETDEELDDFRTEIGFLFQGSALYDSMSVRENLEFPLLRHPKKFGEIEDTTPLVMEALESVGLASAIDKMPNELSGGMQRRIALARTLIMKPKIILYDEPTTGLDPITSSEIIELIQNVQKKYKTSSIMITHDLECARVASDRIVMLIDKKNYKEGTFDELAASEDPKIQEFFK